MIPVELSMMSSSADALGPLGSSTPPEHPPREAVPIKMRVETAYRMSDLVWLEAVRSVRGSDLIRQGVSLQRSDNASNRAAGKPGRRSIAAGQQCRKHGEQVENGKCE